MRCKAGFYKIVRFFAAVNRHGNYRKQQHAKNKRDQKLFEDVPVEPGEHGCEVRIFFKTTMEKK